MITYRQSFGEKVFDVANYILVGLICMACLYPMLHVFFGSISNPVQLLNHVGPIVAPLGFSLKGYSIVLKTPGTIIGYKNTLFYVIAGTALSTLMTILGAYVLSRKQYKLKKFFIAFCVFTMYFSGGMIPVFLLVKSLGLLNTRLAIILPGVIGTWNMIVMKTAFQSVPASLEESAKIDGASEYTVLFRIVLPVSKATIAVIILFYAVGQWNSWFSAMIYLRNRALYPLQLFLREILITNSNIAGTGGGTEEFYYLEDLIKYTSIIVSTVPILCMYPFIQKYFVKGIMMGSLKE